MSLDAGDRIYPDVFRLPIAEHYDMVALAPIPKMFNPSPGMLLFLRRRDGEGLAQNAANFTRRRFPEMSIFHERSSMTAVHKARRASPSNWPIMHESDILEVLKLVIRFGFCRSPAVY